MTTHAMLHGDHPNLQLEVLNHLQTLSLLCTPMTTLLGNTPNESPICDEMKAPFKW
jgi:hypothetical protein